MSEISGQFEFMKHIVDATSDAYHLPNRSTSRLRRAFTLTSDFCTLTSDFMLARLRRVADLVAR
jgi:hypothetical protein